MHQIKNYINGEFLPPRSGSFIDNYNPATGEVYSQIPDSDAEDIEQAVQAAKAAFPRLVWSYQRRKIAAYAETSLVELRNDWTSWQRPKVQTTANRFG